MKQNKSLIEIDEFLVIWHIIKVVPDFHLLCKSFTSEGGEGEESLKELFTHGFP